MWKGGLWWRIRILFVFIIILPITSLRVNLLKQSMNNVIKISSVFVQHCTSLPFHVTKILYTHKLLEWEQHVVAPVRDGSGWLAVTGTGYCFPISSFSGHIGNSLNSPFGYNSRPRHKLRVLSNFAMAPASNAATPTRCHCACGFDCGSMAPHHKQRNAQHRHIYLYSTIQVKSFIIC